MLLNIKVSNNEIKDKKMEYPCLMVSNKSGYIYLMENYTDGMQVGKIDDTTPTYLHYVTNISSDNLELFKGTIKLSNKN